MSPVHGWEGEEFPWFPSTPYLSRPEHRRHEELIGWATIPLSSLPIVVHPKVVPHLVRNHKNRLKVVPLVDCARVVGVAHAWDPGQPDHTGSIWALMHHGTTFRAKEVHPFSFHSSFVSSNRSSLPVTSESLVSREFSRFFLKFHFSISISRYLNFTFTSRKEWNKKSFHFSFLKKSERIIFFTFHFSKKVKLFLISLCFSRKKSEIMQQILRCNI